VALTGRRIATAAALAALAVWAAYLVRAVGSRREPSRDKPLLRVVFLDVGYGDAALVRTPSGKDLLVDAGPGSAGRVSDGGQTLTFSTATPRVPLPRHLRALGVERLEAVVLTHGHYDHWGGLEELLAPGGLPVGRVELPATRSGDEVFQSLLDRVVARGVPLARRRAGDVVPTGDPSVVLRVLAPREPAAAPPAPAAPPTEGAPDEDSLVLRLSHGRVSVLFTGDVEDAAVYHLIEEGEALASTVLKVPDHGSGRSLPTPFLDWVRPSAAVISVEVPNVFGRPQSDALQRLIDRDIPYYRTDNRGDITLTSDGEHWSIRTER
jgi:competence protein ComEC